jgi:putative membrane protein insertion efficiency factor
VSPAAWGLVALVKAYKAVLSPLLPAACRFEPTCSRYAEDAVRRFGARRGSSLAFRRILRCRPGCEGGYDPVPLDEPSG